MKRRDCGLNEHELSAALDAVTVEDAVGLMRQLISIPSPAGQERECARFLEGYMRDAGIEVHLQEVEEGRANVIAVVRGEGTGPTLMLNGHLDTSYTGDFEQDYPVLGLPSPNEQLAPYEIDGGFYGNAYGAYNMKGGVTATFIALLALKRAGVLLPGHVMASGVVGEDEHAPVRGVMRNYEGSKYRGTGFGAQYLVTHCEPIDYAIIAEPSDLYVSNAQTGLVFVKVVVWGKHAYLNLSGRHGRNAIDDASEIVRALRDWGPEYAARHRYDTGLGIMEPPVTVGAIEAGWPFDPCITPGVCHIYLNLRITPAMTGAQAVGELDDLLRSLVAERPGLRYDLEVYSSIPAMVTPVDSLLVRTAVSIMEDRLGFPTRPFGRGQADPFNDTNTFRRHGIPAIKCGPTNRTEPNGNEINRLHGMHVYREDIVLAARFYVHMAFALCGRTRSDL